MLISQSTAAKSLITWNRSSVRLRQNAVEKRRLSRRRLWATEMETTILAALPLKVRYRQPTMNNYLATSCYPWNGSDLFHPDVPTSYISDVALVMSSCYWHTFQVLTKRSGRLAGLLNGPLSPFGNLDHIWWGVSEEDRVLGIPRISDLQSCNAAVRFLSIEPLLENLGEIDLSGIHWVIVGGESGGGEIG